MEPRPWAIRHEGSPMSSSSWPGMSHRPGRPAGEWIRTSVPPTAALIAAMLGVLLLASLPVSAQDLDLTKLSLDELADLRVTTAAKREESLWETSSAVYVVTADDIRRLACRTIPEALRQVPGLNVAQIDAGTWAVSSPRRQRPLCEQDARDDRRAHHLLAALLGRSLGTPERQHGRHRAHRGRPRARRHDLGCERRERGHQHHHPQRG